MVRFGMVVAALGAFASCYRPSPQAGSPCDGGAPCPSGLVCSLATMTCELASSDPDAPIGAGDGPLDDLPPIDLVDLPPGTPCVGSLVVVCTTPQPMDAVKLEGTLDTTSDARCVDGIVSQANTCTIAAGTITIEDQLRVIGDRPLVLAAFSKLEVQGPIDVASHGTVKGAGANATACVAGEPPATGFGGPGGSFGTQGGAGGVSVDPGPAQQATELRGGCAGAAGNPGGAGGHGGGAIALIAGSEVAISAAINASGAGGKTGVSGSSNGGGGGAGGMVIVDAPSLAWGAGASVFANGAGGGSTFGLGGGEDGADPATWNVVASGGSSTFGSDGGAGYAGQVAATSGGRASSVGSGGGGGGGVVRVVGGAVVPTTSISPPPAP